MILVCRSVSPLSSWYTYWRIFQFLTSSFMMGGIQKLSRFQYHLHYMLVTVPFSTLTSTPTQKEDVHCNWKRRICILSFPFFVLIEISDMIMALVSGFDQFSDLIPFVLFEHHFNVIIRTPSLLLNKVTHLIPNIIQRDILNNLASMIDKNMSPTHLYLWIEKDAPNKSVFKTMKTRKNKFKMPRKFGKARCMKKTCKKMGFTEKASCRPYKNCYKKDWVQRPL